MSQSTAAQFLAGVLSLQRLRTYCYRSAMPSALAMFKIKTGSCIPLKKLQGRHHFHTIVSEQSNTICSNLAATFSNKSGRFFERCNCFYIFVYLLERSGFQTQVALLKRCVKRVSAHFKGASMTSFGLNESMNKRKDQQQL